MFRLCFYKTLYFIAGSDNGILELHVLDNEGNHINSITLNDLPYYSLAGMTATSDGHLWIAGTYGQDLETARIFFNKILVEDLLTGIESEKASSIRIHPNPFKNKLFISGLESEFNNEIRIFNTLGKEVFHQENVFRSINISMLNYGMYVVEIASEKTSFRKKILIIK